MVIGVDLGGMSAKAAVLSNGKIIGKARVETSARNSAEETAKAIAELCREATQGAGISFDEVQAIGIGSPGVIDSASGTVVLWSNYGWKDVPLAALVSKYSGKKVFLTNDANAAALGEAKYGAGKKFSDSLLITLGTGVGGGVVLAGKLFEGYRSAGGEIGHTVIRQDGIPCTCGRKGCLECYASATALMRMTREEMQRVPDSAMWLDAPSLDKVNGITAFKAAKGGDPAAKRVISQYIVALADGIANLVNILRPQAIILGGGVSAEGDALLVPLKEEVYPRLYVSEEYAPLEILCAELGNDAGLYGSAQYALEHL